MIKVVNTDVVVLREKKGRPTLLEVFDRRYVLDTQSKEGAAMDDKANRKSRNRNQDE